MTVFTIGHSTHPAGEFLDLLRSHGITALADVRAFPGSRRHPHFSKQALESLLREHGIAYHHFRDLGGHRRPLPDSPNGGWRNESFRGYADYMATPAFSAALDELLALAQRERVAVMCAEARWWQCHRQLIADALVARGIEVRHILSRQDAPAHELTPFARITAGRIEYPALV